MHKIFSPTVKRGRVFLAGITGHPAILPRAAAPPVCPSPVTLACSIIYSRVSKVVADYDKLIYING